MFEHKQNVTIVKGTGREKVYAQMLFQMLSELPNINSPQPITETEYNKSVVTIGSDGKPKVPNGKIIFFGNGKEAQIQGKSVDWEYNQFGMKYGWMGNRCVITADVNEIKLEEQSKFADYYNSKVEEFKSFIKLSGIDISNISYSDVEHLDMNEIYDEFKWEEYDDVGDKIGKTIAAAVCIPLILIAGGLKGINDTYQDTVAIFERKDLWRNQYLLLVLEFAINGFSRFISNLEEKKSKGKVTIVYDTKDAGYSHLLHNFIQQYSEYDVMEFTEKMFIDNAKMFSANNKIIFLGNTKSAKERWLENYKYAYDKHGMHYGWIGNQAFINVSPLKSENEKKLFKDFYNQEMEEYSNRKDTNAKAMAIQGLALLGVTSSAMLALGLLGIFAGVSYTVTLGISDAIIFSANAAAELKERQYLLLLSEFIADGFDKFMEG